MKTTYWLVAAAAVAAAGVTVYTRLTAKDSLAPKVPLTAERSTKDAPRLKLPPVSTPPDEPLAIPDVSGKPIPSEPRQLPISTQVSVPQPEPVSIPSVIPVSAQEPVPPPAPAAPAVPPAAPPLSPLPKSSDALPPIVVPPVPVPPTAVPPEPITPVTPNPVAPSPLPPVPPAAVPPVPVPPAVTVPSPVPQAPLDLAPMNTDVRPVVPTAPTALLAPTTPTPAPSPALQPPVASAPTSARPLPSIGSDSPAPAPAETSAATGRYVVLKGDKLIEGSSVVVNGDTVLIHQGVLDRPFPKGDVQFVASSKDEVYKFMLAKVPANDAGARLKVARWCMFSGMREQALAEAREVQKLQPTNHSAADLIRSLELSLRQFPPATALKMSPPEAPTFPAELRSTPAPLPPTSPSGPGEPVADVTPEAALIFGTRVQPFLANQCVSCHAHPLYKGEFKLARVAQTGAGPQATRANLLAVARQLKKDDPAASPLLMKSLTAHGDMQRPAVESRQAPVYQTLEAWVELAVGAPIVVPAPMPTPTAPVATPATPEGPPATESAFPPMPAAVQPVLPPPAPTPVVPPMPPAAQPVLPPPVQQIPAPQMPAVAPPPITVPPPMPIVPMPDPLAPTTPAVSPPAPAGQPKPALPPVTTPPIPLPPATGPLPPLPSPQPVAPPSIPPADTGTKPAPMPVIPPIPPATAAPKPPSPIVPTSGSQFGATIPPKPPATGPSGDEFDPAGFNEGQK